MIYSTPIQLRKAADIQEKIQWLQEELGRLLPSRFMRSDGDFPHGHILRQAANIQDKIESLKTECDRLLGNNGPAPAQPTEAPKKKKGKMSAAGRAAIRAAQKARWAKIKGTAPSAIPARKAKRKFSAQAMANIRAGVAREMAAQGKAPSAEPAQAKCKLSPAHKAALATAAKGRWARVKKAGQSRP
jgi:hypothetical protein